MASPPPAGFSPFFGTSCAAPHAAASPPWSCPTIPASRRPRCAASSPIPASTSWSRLGPRFRLRHPHAPLRPPTHPAPTTPAFSSPGRLDSHLPATSRHTLRRHSAPTTIFSSPATRHLDQSRLARNDDTNSTFLDSTANGTRRYYRAQLGP